MAGLYGPVKPRAYDTGMHYGRNNHAGTEHRVVLERMYNMQTRKLSLSNSNNQIFIAPYASYGGADYL